MKARRRRRSRLQLEYDKLAAADAGLEERLADLPGRVFSGKRHPTPEARAVFFCYVLPADVRTEPGRRRATVDGRSRPGGVVSVRPGNRASAGRPGEDRRDDSLPARHAAALHDGEGDAVGSPRQGGTAHQEHLPEKRTGSRRRQAGAESLDGVELDCPSRSLQA